MVDANTIVTSLTLILVALMGIYLDRVARAKREFALTMSTQFKEVEETVKALDLRVQQSENRAVALETKSHNQANALVKLGEDLADIRDNMVRRADLDTLLEQITALRPRTRKT